MKKFTAIFASALLLIGAAIGFAGCGEHYSETFPGKLSADTYETTDTAAAAFLENELASDDTAVSFVSYTRTGEISDEELEAFDLGGVKAENISSGEWGKIEYTAVTEAAAAETAASLAAQPDGKLEVTVGMFKIGDSYRYFVPLAATGEMISKSYYESVLDAEKYKNCTTSYDMTLEYNVSASGQSLYIKLNMGVNMKITETAAMMEIHIGGNMSSGGQSQNMQDETLRAYLVRSGNTAIAYVENNGTWYPTSLDGVSTWDDLYETQLKDFLDHSYFEKTSTGFKLAPAKFNQYAIKYITSSENSSLGLDFDFGKMGGFNGEASYFVTEGRLSGVTIRLDAQYTDPGTGGTFRVNLSGNNKYYDFGTTSVELPAEIRTNAN